MIYLLYAGSVFGSNSFSAEIVNKRISIALLITFFLEKEPHSYTAYHRKKQNQRKTGVEFTLPAAP